MKNCLLYLFLGLFLVILQEAKALSISEQFGKLLNNNKKFQN